MNAPARPFVLSAFTMSTVSHGNFGLWRHPDDQTAEYLIPELRRRGRAYPVADPTTLRQRLFPDGSALLPDDHPASTFRRERSPSAPNT